MKFLSKNKNILKIFLNFFIQKNFLKIFFIYRQRRREGQRGRETSVCDCFSHAPYWGPGPQPRQVPWLGTEPVTIWFAGPHSIHWATPARAILEIFGIWLPNCFPERLHPSPLLPHGRKMLILPDLGCYYFSNPVISIYFKNGMSRLFCLETSKVDLFFFKFLSPLPTFLM